MDSDKMEIKQYKSKFENYDISQRLSDLESVLKIQCSKGNYDYDDYMRGMANGLLLAWNIIREPYGTKINYFEKEELKNG